MRISALIFTAFGLCALSGNVAADELAPIVPKGFVVDTVAAEPLVRNPCVMAFDRLGRVCIGQGPQYRSPTPETPGDRVDILFDVDGDGTADKVHTFADGFNCIQGLAWKGRDLWVANAPDLTIVRDLDGDDVADEYVRVYTDLGNLEHALHGLNFGPDGKLYMSKGNSRGYNEPDRFAPRPFRDLWGLSSPDDMPDKVPSETFTRDEYRRSYHSPEDDWGQQGGILRCNADGRQLEIVSRGYRNPWDIAFDDAFNWLGTDNDQTQGDKIVAPFYGSHFGWGHAWSYNWTGKDHLPTVPASADLFEGSGTGVVHYHAAHFPPEYRNIYFVNDWLRREMYAFRPVWEGGLLRCEGAFPEVFAHAGGGRSMPASSGRVFEPTDIEVGPDGALYVLSWGQAYGATIKDGQQVDVGRVYRIRHQTSPLVEWTPADRQQPSTQWTLEQLFTDLGSSVGAWRTDAQQELLRRGPAARDFLLRRLRDSDLTTAEQTWALWTVGQMSPDDSHLQDWFTERLLDDASPHNVRLQSLRILAFRCQQSTPPATLPEAVQQLLSSDDAQLRHEAILAMHQAGQSQFVPGLLDLAARETDRIVFYSVWNALRTLTDKSARQTWLNDPRGGVRLAALLILLEISTPDADTILPFRRDSDQRVAGLAELWLQKTGGADPIVKLDPPPGEYSEPVLVTLTTNVPDSRITYTLDGSIPVKTSTRYTAPIPVGRSQTLKVHVEQQAIQVGPVVTGEYRIRQVQPYRHRRFVTNIQPASGRPYEMEWTGLSVGTRHYTDRGYAVTDVPQQLRGLPFLRTSNDDDRRPGTNELSFESDTDVTVYLGIDVRCDEPLAWMNVGQPDGFHDTGLHVETTDPDFQIYRKEFPAGRIVLGGNTNRPDDSSRGNYIVIFDHSPLAPQPQEHEATAEAVLAALATADVERGRELFLHSRGAGCIKCHVMEGRGNRFAPDLSDIGSRARRPEILIESILKPSAVITEGFAQQQIITTDGRSFSGAVLEETGRSLKLVNSDGHTTELLRSDIDERISTKISAMPAGFGRMMTAGQLADVVAWLGTQQATASRQAFRFHDTPDRLGIHFGDQQVAAWVKKHPQMTRPGLADLKTPSGIQVTRNFPPRAPEDVTPGQDRVDHAMMHPGLWISFGDINGNDYWRLKARVDFDGFVSPPKAGANRAEFSVRNIYRTEDGTDIVCTEITHYRFRKVDEGMLLTVDTSFGSDDHDFYFGDQEESGLAIRVASPIRVDGGNGTILNNHGQRNGKEIWGNPASWFDYFGTVNGRQIGLMVGSSPANSLPSWLHARDYGVVVTNPFPRQPRERREPYVKTWVRQGEPLQLSWAVLIHDLPEDRPLDHQVAWKMMQQEFQQDR